MWLCLPAFGVSAWVGLSGSWRYFADVSNIGQETARCSAFYPLCRSSPWCVACEYGSISRFKGVLRGFYGADVYLYGLRSLRGLCGLCVRVELGG